MLEMSRRRQTPVADVAGIGEKTAARLTEAGLATLADLLDKSAAELAEIEGIGEKTAEKILEAARAAEQAPPGDAEAREGEEAAGPEAVSEETEETGVRE